MRRYLFILLFLFVLITPFVLRLAIGKQSRSSAPSDALRLVIISPHPESIRREFNDAFAEYYRDRFHQDVVLDFRNYGGASDIVRFFDATKESMFDKQGTFKIDLVWGGGDYLFDQQLKKPGYLQGVKLDDAVMHAAFPKPDINGVALYDVKSNPPTWYGTALSSFGIVYNKDVVRYLHAPPPLTWRDMTEPRYRGWIVLADPTRSASAKQVFMIIVERAMADAKQRGRSEDDGWADGMGLVRQIAANARYFSDAGSSVPGVVSGGDAAAGMAIDFYARAQVEAVGEARLAYVEPAGATIVNPDPIAMVRGAEHPELAKRFIDFALSDRGQRLLITRAGADGGPRSTSLRRLPIARSVYDSPRDFTEPVNPFVATSSFNTSNARKKTFPILGELIQASCMDLLDELCATRAAILASPRAAELDAKLGKFPFDQKEALSRAQAWDAAKTNPLERIRMMRQWTTAFREEYRLLREEAGDSAKSE